MRFVRVCLAVTGSSPGHGKPAGKADLRAYRDMLAGVREAVLPLVKAGKTVEEAKAAKRLAALDAKWGSGFIKTDVMVETAYRSLKK